MDNTHIPTPLLSWALQGDWYIISMGSTDWIFPGSNTPTPSRESPSPPQDILSEFSDILVSHVNFNTVTHDPSPPQDILLEFSDISVSHVNFNTVTHDGLKSYQPYPSRNTPDHPALSRAPAVPHRPTPPTSQYPVNRADSNDIDHRSRKRTSNILLRFRGPDGTVRITVDPADTFGRLGEKLSEALPATVDLDTLTLANSPTTTRDIKLLKEIARYEISKVDFHHGDMVFINYKHVGAL